MTLRLRLTLFYTLLVALVLAGSGVGLYFLLAHNLYAALDAGLEEAAELLSGYLDTEGGSFVLREPDEPVPALSTDSVAVLYDALGRRRDSLNTVPAALVVTPPGFHTWRDRRVYARAVPGGTLLILRARAGVRESLAQFSRSFLTLAPLATAVAFGLGYLLAGRALKPVGELTYAARDLARRRAWRERLPEPRHRDELWRLAHGTNDLLNALESVIESERRFTADAAHELRTPLTVLRGRLEKALEQTTEVKAATSLRKALVAGDVLWELAEKLLLLARSEAGQGFVTEPVALGEVAFASAELLRPLFLDKDLTLTLGLPESPVWVRGDRAALALAVRNLLENAAKFTAQGEVTLALTVVGDAAQLSVKDTGTGITQRARAQLFERFYQTDVSHRRSGAGLGLALVKSVVTWHGGEVWLEEGGDGAEFVLSLPLIQIGQRKEELLYLDP